MLESHNVLIIKMHKSELKMLTINYSFASTHLGEVIIASTHIGVCYLAFITNGDDALCYLHYRFPHANFSKTKDQIQISALESFSQNTNKTTAIKLHMLGSDFQLSVWNALLKIPFAKNTSYGAIAKAIEKPNASRAVGTAIGNNPIAIIIPCHRVIQKSGGIGGYRWGIDIKKQLIQWENSSK